MRTETVLGFDFGTKRIGVAIGQSITGTARPLALITEKNKILIWRNIKKLLNEWKPNFLVVGLPLNMDGTEQSISIKARKFAKQLQNYFHIHVELQDERLTSIEAKANIFEHGGYRALQSNIYIDSQAAVIILQDWFKKY
ncbi:Holliday junction resolvase RuvX [Pantoea sp. Aalb]|uniref:Holliday junction resolvase RuvX n=1 Tax=Pantoea sp. Aalb TaxID=2576762 RepID=UPI001325F2F8|nr:Holliday junction resolvase RuvX [Pantoea sp. Aalb]MXP67720.1 Holliday junction resolvase RuvX [Pantoea sp. Aalb]